MAFQPLFFTIYPTKKHRFSLYGQKKHLKIDLSYQKLTLQKQKSPKSKKPSLNERVCILKRTRSVHQLDESNPQYSLAANPVYPPLLPRSTPLSKSCVLPVGPSAKKSESDFSVFNKKQSVQAGCFFYCPETVKFCTICKIIQQFA